LVAKSGDRAQVRLFGDTLAQAVAERESQIVLGLDPDPMALWPGTEEPSQGSAAQRAASAVLAHCRVLIDAVAPACVAVKLQLACFERLAEPGWSTLRAVAEHARAHGLLVIADGKRGDISVSAHAYGQALMGSVQTPFGQVQGLQADLVTINPLMGADAMVPFISVARKAGAGVLVLVRTSNPGAADVEDLKLADGKTVWERIAMLVNELGQEGVGQAGLSDVGAVMGATVPEHLTQARKLMPNTVFLLPGVGAQGGRVQDLIDAFAPGHAGGLITASRSIVQAHLSAGGSPAEAARAEAERLRQAAWTLAGR
jgi:orotidine-5'-phosphate decarboxylase